MINGYRIIDFHAHVGSWQQYGMNDGAEQMLRAMDLAGVDQACVFNVFHGNHRQANDEVARFVEKNPERFIGFAFVTPHYPEEVRDELGRAIDRLGFKAIKIYPPYFHEPVTHPVWEPVFQFANERGLVLISHTWGGSALCDPLLFAELAQRYPRVYWVLGHAGGTPEGRQVAIQAAQSAPNIYLEICSSWRNFGSIEALVEGAGEDRVLYGSDLPLIEPRIQVGRVVTAKIPGRAKHQVLGENALRLLGLS